MRQQVSGADIHKVARAGRDRRGRIQDPRVGFDEILRCAGIAKPAHARSMTAGSRIPHHVQDVFSVGEHLGPPIDIVQPLQRSA